jgi:hypothetical protein
MNVTVGVTDESGDRDRLEIAVPEQFCSKVGKRNSIETTVVEHSGA